MQVLLLWIVTLSHARNSSVNTRSSWVGVLDRRPLFSHSETSVQWCTLTWQIVMRTFRGGTSEQSRDPRWFVRLLSLQNAWPHAGRWRLWALAPSCARACSTIACWICAGLFCCSFKVCQPSREFCSSALLKYCNKCDFREGWAKIVELRDGEVPFVG